MKLCLVISENHEDRTTVKNLIDDLGFPCSEADSLNDAFTACQALMPDIIFLDDNSAESDSDDFILNIRTTRKGSRPFLIYFGDDKKKESDESLLNCGANAYICTPINKESVSAKLAQLGLIKVPQ